MKIDNQHHLTYCTNIHPGQDWERTFNSLKEYVPKIQHLAKDKPFGLGLRLSNKASKELNEGNHLIVFKQWLDRNNLYVFTMNGFPYGNFHDERVKDQVHAPDWTTPERLAYTQRLFEQLAYLIPEDVNGGISTSPVSYTHWYALDKEKQIAFEKAAAHMATIVLQLYHLEESKGTYLHLDIEPEPDGLIENSDEVLQFFDKYLVPIATEILNKELQKTGVEAEYLIKRYITVCYDVCHFALAYEEPDYTIEKLFDAGIKIGKIQISAALKILFNTTDNTAVWEALEQFNEPTYLHQVTKKVNGTVVTYNDLPMLLKNKEEDTELRAHFHVPIFLEKFGALYSTQDHILKVIAYIKKHKVTQHLEIETYTWDVLPLALKKELSVSIVREIQWLQDKL